MKLPNALQQKVMTIKLFLTSLSICHIHRFALTGGELRLSSFLLADSLKYPQLREEFFWNPVR
jgi:hypothetical protein